MTPWHLTDRKQKASYWADVSLGLCPSTYSRDLNLLDDFCQVIFEIGLSFLQVKVTFDLRSPDEQGLSLKLSTLVFLDRSSPMIPATGVECPHLLIMIVHCCSKGLKRIKTYVLTELLNVKISIQSHVSEMRMQPVGSGRGGRPALG